jgi:predicted nuclease with TOPRIM domain
MLVSVAREGTQMSEDSSVRQHIQDLVAEEHSLRERLASGEISVEEEHARLKDVEVQLDQLWDLLRQRSARREFSQDPDDASPRTRATVEGYLQ